MKITPKSFETSINEKHHLFHENKSESVHHNSQLMVKTCYRVLKRGESKGRGCSWGTPRIPFWEDWGSIREASGNMTSYPKTVRNFHPEVCPPQKKWFEIIISTGRLDPSGSLLVGSMCSQTWDFFVFFRAD